MKYLLGIDIGTTNVKAVLFDVQGNIASIAKQPYPTSHPHPGWALQEPADWYHGVLEAVKTLFLQTRIDPGEILCAGLTGHIRTVAFLDQDFQKVYPGIVWSDTRSDKIAQRLNEEMEGFLVEMTGNRAATNFSLPQILWLRESCPELWERTAYFSTPKDYVIRKLTGNFVSDASNQAGSLLLDIRMKQWSGEVLKRFGLKESSLPQIKRSVDIAGYVNEQAARETGLRKGMPVVIGGGDNDCAAIGAGAYNQGIVSVSLGTAGIILTLLDKPDMQAFGALDLFPHVIPEGWYIMGMVKAAGYAVEWIKDRLTEESSDSKEISVQKWIPAMETEIGDYEPGSGGVFCFPYYQGKGNPNKNPLARGVIWGLESGHTNKHLLQASMEGVGFCIRECVQAIENVTAVKEIVCCGGGSSSQLWMRMLADILGKPVSVNEKTEEGALGAAICGAVGIGLYPSIQDACQVLTHQEKRYIPHPENVQAYNRLFGQFCQLSKAFWN